ncbi:defective in methylation-7 protein [Hirsutella rhossiliensis]|uniref:Defective in methylation-7 protein n=1 Tax=Hirsutella rhossiliensis TaxID=111463 RepID=A0A9P8N5M3_9HYPO|nr:defective in methylation-7 protein [Hirsutella rhossiliensis]KAH0965082.1 defective in methylation-7 protein [Hirsutella rhossiliensis]
MVGRRRRASTSSVDSVDDSQIRWRQEASVVRSVPKDVLSDDWPIFELRDAVVLHGDGHTLENALHVGIRGPYIVRGHLVIDDPSQKSRLIMRVRKSIPLEIRQCVSYSIGESPDGSPLIWVSGRGGWYEINPSPAYRSIYRKMCEATTLYYNMVDIYNSRRAPKRSKKQKQSSLMDELASIFLQYAARVGDGCTFDEVIARCSEHAGFFICQFAQQESLIDWIPTAFYRWLTTEHAELVQKIEDSMKNPRKLCPMPSAEALSPMPRESASTPLPKSSSVEAAMSRQSSRVASSRVPSAAANVAPELKPRSVPPPPKQSPRQTTQPESAAAGDDESPFDSVFNAMEMAYDALIDTKKGLATTSVLNKIYFTYSFPQYRDGTVGSFKIPVQEVLHYNASALLENLEKSKYESHEIYAFLEQLSTAELRLVVFKPSDFPVKLVPRKRMVRQSKKDIQPSPATVAPVTTRGRGGPDGAGSADVAAAGRGKSLKREGRRTGRKSFLRPAVTNKKRPHSQLESDSEAEAEAPGLGNSHYFSDGDDAMEDAPDVETPQDGDTPDSGRPALHQETPIKIVIRAEKIPSTTPQGPDNTWTCDQEGCGYIVRGGDDEECQARIREHFDDHEQQLERVSLAVTESRGHLPINHLLEKIKRMGEKASEGPQQTMDGLLVPQPIKRKLIV